MLRRRPGATSKLDAVDLKLLEGVEAGLTWGSLIQSTACDAEEATLRVLRLIQQGHLEGKPGDMGQRAPSNPVHSTMTQPPSATRSLHTAITRALSSIPSAAASAAPSVPPASFGSRADPRASTFGSRADPRASTFGSRADPRASTQPPSTSPPGKTLPPSALAAREALLRELATRRSGTSYPPAARSAISSGPSPKDPLVGYYSVRPGETARGSSSPPAASSSPPSPRQVASSTPPRRDSGQPSARPNAIASSLPPGTRGGADSSLTSLIEELMNGQERERWCAMQLREALEHERSGHTQEAIGTLQTVMAQLSDPRIRVERDRLQAQVLKATSGVYRAQALGEERAQKHKEAAESWRKVLEACPEDSEAAIHAASCCMEIGDIRQAGLHARKAVELAPDNVIAHRLLLRFFRKTGMELNANRERDILRKLAKG